MLENYVDSFLDNQIAALFELEDAIEYCDYDYYYATLTSINGLGPYLQKAAPEMAERLQGVIVAIDQGFDDGGIFDYFSIETDLNVLISYLRQKSEVRPYWGDDNYDESLNDCLQHLYNQTDEVYDYQILPISDLVDSSIEAKKARSRRRAEKVQVTANEVYRYILSSDHPVQRSILLKKISNCSDQAIAVAASRHDVINFHGEYVPASVLEIPASVKAVLRDSVNSVLSDKGIHHAQELFDILQPQFRSLFNSRFINTQYKLFSALNYWFPTNYNYSRPYLARKSVKILSQQEQLARYVCKKAETAVSEMVDFAKSQHIKVNSILGVINSLNDSVLLKDRDTLIRIDEIEIDKPLLRKIREAVMDELKSNPCKAIRDLHCFASFSPISIPWDEWLLYSVFNKWFPGLEVCTTSKQFRLSVPVVSVFGKTDPKTLEDIARVYSGAVNITPNNMVDNLDDLDDLITDYIDLDFDWDDE